MPGLDALPTWRQQVEDARRDVVSSPLSASTNGNHFETNAEADAESIRSENALSSFRPRNAFATYLRECRERHYNCEQTYCPRCARTFRRYFAGELMRLTYKFHGAIKISTVLLHTVPKGELGSLGIARFNQLLRKRLGRAGLGEVAVIGGFEVMYRARERDWVLHINLVFFGGDPNAIAAFGNTFAGSNLYRPVQTVDLKDPLKQLTYVLKFTTYHRPLKQIGPKKSPAKPLNLAEHFELIGWMAQHEFTDHLFLFNARRYGPTIKFSSKASARKA